MVDCRPLTVSIWGERGRGSRPPQTNFLKQRLQVLADKRIEFFGALLQQLLKDIEIADRAGLLAEPFEPFVHHLGPQRRYIGREQTDR